MGQLPFEITPQVQRYLEDILFLDKEYLFDKKYTGGAGRELFCLIKKEYPDELSTPRQRDNRHKFWMYLVKQNVIKYFFSGESIVKNIKLSPSREERLKDGKNIEIAISKNDKDEHPIRFYLAKPKTWKQDFYDLANRNSYDFVVFQILDIGLVEELLRKVKSGDEKIPEDKSGTEYLITKDGEGNFFFGVDRRYLNFRKTYPYYKVIVAIYEISRNKKGGRKTDEVYITYNEINDYLKKFYKMSPMNVKDIQNTFNNVIIRKYLPKTPEGREIIEPDGKKEGVFFYNPSLK